jgi:hypothetical protein
MLQTIKDHRAGVLAFVIVLLLMPLGHAMMVLMEQWVGAARYTGALLVGLIGVVLLWWGVRRPGNDLYATLLGSLAGVLVWTGWVEFSFVWIAHKLGVPPLIENGEVATKPEYLVMLSSIGLLGGVLLIFFFSQTRCQFFNWFQRKLGYKHMLKDPGTAAPRPLAVIAFIEMVMVIWTFYILLLLIYDNDIAGDRHPITYAVAFGSLFWSLYLFVKLIRIKAFDHAIRYAIPTVVIFWNFVEITGRWNLFKEIWVHPFEHWVENTIILASLVFFIVYYLVSSRRDRQRKSRAAGAD